MTAGNHQSAAKEAAPAGTAADGSIRVRTPANLLAIIPHLLGFHPVNSLVILGTDPSRHTSRVVLRYELSNPPDSWTAGEIIRHATGILVAQHDTRAFVVGYGPSRLVDSIIEHLREADPPAGLTLADILRVEDGRYWSYLCDQPACCPADGTPFDPNADPAFAALTASGSQVFASREAFAGSVAAVSGKAATSMRQATRRAEDRAARLATRTTSDIRETIVAAGLETVAKAIKHYRGGGQFPPGANAAWLTLMLRDLRVRDTAWSQMAPEHRKAHRMLWTDLTRLARPGYVAAPASLLAFVAWESGNGALANVALDRALADDPSYSMATLLRRVINGGAPPDMARLLVRDAGGIVAGSWHTGESDRPLLLAP